MRMRHLLRTTRASALLVVAAILFAASAPAVITNYTVTQNGAATFVPLTGSTVVHHMMGDDNWSGPIPIGFEFTYDGVRYSHVGASSNGYVYFAASFTLATTATNSLSAGTVANGRPFLAPLWDDCMTGGHTNSIPSYKTEGIVGSRVFTFEWLNQPWLYDSAGGVISMQVKLYEADGVVEFMYRPEATAIGATAVSASCGISAVGTGASNFLSLSNLSGAATVSSVTETTAIAAKPTADLQIRFTPPILAAGATALTPTVPAAPTGGTQINLAWTNPVDATLRATHVWYSDDAGATRRFLGTVAAPGNTFTVTSLGWNSAYQFWVQSVTEGFMAAPTGPAAASTLTGTAPTTFLLDGTAGNTITAAIANCTANGLAGPTLIELTGTYTSALEAVPILIGPLAGRATPLTIRPAAGATGRLITATSTTNSTIRLENTRFVTIDGRPGGTGGASPTNLIIRNANATGTASAFPVALLCLDTTDSNIQYCNLQASNPGASAASIGSIVTIAQLANPHGSDRLNFSFNDFGPAGATLPIRGIMAFAPSIPGPTLDCYNEDIVVANNTFHDYHYGIAFATGLTAGVVANVGNQRWTIENNFFWQNAPRVVTATTEVRAISTNHLGGGMIVRNNTIGTDSTGIPVYTLTGGANRIQAIFMTGGFPVKNECYNNTIRNFSQVSSSTGSTVSGIFSGIHAGSFGTLEVLNNTIGSQSALGNIAVQGGSGVECYAAGINIFGTGNMLIDGNNIGGITARSTAAGSQSHVMGIYDRTFCSTFGVFSAYWSALHTITNNTIGGTVANSMTAGDAAVTTTGISGAWGVRIESSTGGGTVFGGTLITTGRFNINGNTIRNMATVMLNNAGLSASVLRGIAVGPIGAALGVFPVATVENNTISGLTFGSNNNTGVDNTAPAIGINVVSAASPAIAGQVVTRNTISGLVHAPTALGAGLQSRMYGIHLGTPAISTANSVTRNLVHGLDNQSTNVGSVAYGISTTAGAPVAFENNMVRLGLDAAGADITSGSIQFAGLRDSSAAGVAHAINHNSILVTGSGVGAGGTFTAGLIKTVVPTAGSVSIRNNILTNTRLNGVGVGTHFCIVLQNSGANMDADYNILFHGGASGQAVGGINATAPSVATTLGQWQIDSNEDLNSRFNDPLFVAAGGAIPNLHIQTTSPSAVEHLTAPVLATLDFDGQTRASFAPTNVDLGADAGAFDVVAPTLATVVSTTPTSIDATFSEALETVVIPAGNFSISGPGAGTLAANPNTAAFVSGATWDLDWAAGSQVFAANYTLALSAASVIDRSGNPNVLTSAIGSGVPVELSAFGLE